MWSDLLTVGLPPPPHILVLYSLVSSVSVLAPAMLARVGVVVALVHVDVAVWSLEARLAGAPVVVA